jgi:hypothetical protein
MFSRKGSRFSWNLGVIFGSFYGYFGSITMAIVNYHGSSMKINYNEVRGCLAAILANQL